MCTATIREFAWNILIYMVNILTVPVYRKRFSRPHARLEDAVRTRPPVPPRYAQITEAARPPALRDRGRTVVYGKNQGISMTYRATAGPELPCAAPANRRVREDPAPGTAPAALTVCYRRCGRNLRQGTDGQAPRCGIAGKLRKRLETWPWFAVKIKAAGRKTSPVKASWGHWQGVS